MNPLNQSVSLLGIGTANPTFRMSQADAAEMASVICCETDRQRKLLRTLYRKSGVENRYTIVPHTTAYDWVERDQGNGDQADQETVVVTQGPTTAERIGYYEQFAPEVAQAAAEQAISNAGVSAEEITHLVTVSCTGFSAPGTDIHLFKTLGLRQTVQRVNVGFMGCHGAINGLRVAQGLVCQSPENRVLLSATEVCSMHYRFRWDPDKFMGNLLFADGSAAMVLSNSRRSQDPASVDKTESESSWNLLGTGSCYFPNSTEAMTWRIGDHGFEMTLSAEVPDLIQSHLSAWLSEWLSQFGLRKEDVGTWAVHPGGPRILNSVQACLELDESELRYSREILKEYGNMSSPTVLFIFNKAMQEAAKKPCVMLGFGPGLVAEVALWG